MSHPLDLLLNPVIPVVDDVSPGRSLAEDIVIRRNPADEVQTVRRWQRAEDATVRRRPTSDVSIRR